MRRLQMAVFYSPFTIDNSQKQKQTFCFSANNQLPTTNVIPVNCQLILP